MLESKQANKNKYIKEKERSCGYKDMDTFGLIKLHLTDESIKIQLHSLVFL